MNEKLIELKLRESVKKLGGIALKLFSPSFTGLPDRLVLMPGGRASFAEIKTTGKNVTLRQQTVLGLLSKLGFLAVVIDSQESLNEFLKNIQNDL